MLGQLFAIAVALILTYFLLRLRQFIGSHRHNNPPSYRAYLVNLAEAEKSAEDGELRTWPTELELQANPLARQQAAGIREKGQR